MASSPRTLAAAYREWIVRNKDAFSSIESSARLALLVLPSRFGNSELISEAVYAVFNLTGVFNDSVFVDKLRAVQRARTQPTPQVLASTIATTVPPPSLSTPLSLLSCLSQTELLLEMCVAAGSSEIHPPFDAPFTPRSPSIAGRFSAALSSADTATSARWVVVTAIELLKFVLRFYLFVVTRCSLQTFRALPSREEVHPLIGALSESDTSLLSEPRTDESMPVKRKTLMDKKKGHTPTLSLGEGGEMCLVEVVSVRDGLQALWRDLRCRDALTAGELLVMLRPLVYLALFFRFGRRSWKPWAVSLVVEALGKFLSGKGRNAREGREALRRTAGFLYSLLRPPFFTWLTERSSLSSIIATSYSIPLFGIAMRILMGYLETYQRYHFFSNKE